MANRSDTSGELIIAGDDYIQSVEIFEFGSAADPADIESVELIIHTPYDERVYDSVGNENNTYCFFIPGEETLELADEAEDGVLELCVRVTRANGSRVTPIHRMPVAIRRC